MLCTWLGQLRPSHEVYQALGEVYRVIDIAGEGGGRLPGVPLLLRSGGGRAGRSVAGRR